MVTCLRNKQPGSVMTASRESDILTVKRQAVKIYMPMVLKRFFTFLHVTAFLTVCHHLTKWHDTDIIY